MRASKSAMDLMRAGRGLLVLDSYAEGLVLRATGGRHSLESYVPLVSATSGLAEYVSGILLTGRQLLQSPQLRQDVDGSIQLGVHIRAERARQDGTSSFPRLGQRLRLLRGMGVTFVEWRTNLPSFSIRQSTAPIDAEGLARAARLTQDEGLTPILTIAAPDLGGQSMTATSAVMRRALDALFEQSALAGVSSQAMLLRLGLVIPADWRPSRTTIAQIAGATSDVIRDGVPAGIAGVLVMSSGHDLRTACEAAATVRLESWRCVPPRPVTFAFTRTLVADSLSCWNGAPDHRAAQQRLLQACRAASQSVSPFLAA